MVPTTNRCRRAIELRPHRPCCLTSFQQSMARVKSSSNCTRSMHQRHARTFSSWQEPQCTTTWDALGCHFVIDTLHFVVQLFLILGKERLLQWCYGKAGSRWSRYTIQDLVALTSSACVSPVPSHCSRLRGPRRRPYRHRTRRLLHLWVWIWDSTVVNRRIRDQWIWTDIRWLCYG